MHLTFDQYLLLIRGVVPPSVLHRQAHRHLLELCPVCEREGEVAAAAGVVAIGAAPVRIAAQPIGAPESADGWEGEVPETSSEDALHVAPGCYERAKAYRAQLRELMRRAREDLKRLRQWPREEWPGRVERANGRFSSRAFADLLLVEAHRLVARAPRVAEALAALMPHVLHRHAGADGPAWAKALFARAAAHRANALRVAGELLAADAAFRRLRLEVQDEPLHDAYAVAEIASLEASLRIDLRELEDARLLLAEAAAGYEAAGDPLGTGKTLVKQANLLQTLGQAAEIPPLLERAAKLFDPEVHPFLFQSTVTGRVNALCDLDRAAKAEDLLETHRTLYLAAGEEYGPTLHTALQARIDLGMGRLDRAVEGLTAARDGLLALGRDYDAILASLYLADALLASGKLAELRQLAGDLVALFRSVGVDREALAALRLLAEAIRAERVTSAFIADLRKSLVGLG